MSNCSSSLVEERWIKEPCKSSAGISWKRSCFSLESLYHHQAKQDPSLYIFVAVFLAFASFFLHRVVIRTPRMATKMKGIYKSFKYISQIFVVKEREMEIGYPTDVKHVAHIGWDGQSGSAPSWMNEFKAAPDFTSSIGNPVDSSPWSSQDFEQQMGQQPASELFKDILPTDLPKIPKKQKRKKKSSNNSPKSSSSSSRSSRAAKTKATYSEMEKSNIQM
ncbi:CRIB domain-containing protein RIC10 [Citrus sinensis]|uniref:CRIB domain-containing protein n=2 Tax=Citrus TaxID=2706 RepID=A0A067GJB3_CITSI|nr:CRIB domain-containing protein RIC10 [Citrus x clementina]XP_006467994.1 CRIB domain-containing protein RIC10 [Citrus sinensis]KDO75532.1 hypothetical protein CISIN_1g027719mg [Citrus sinensis]